MASSGSTRVRRRRAEAAAKAAPAQAPAAAGEPTPPPAPRAGAAAAARPPTAKFSLAGTGIAPKAAAAKPPTAKFSLAGTGMAPKAAPARAAVPPRPPSLLAQRTLAVIGAGKIGETLIQGLLASRAVSPAQLIATTRSREHSQAVARKFHIRVAPANAVAAKAADIVLLCVKPQVMAEVLGEIRPVLEPRQLVVSVAASVGTVYIDRLLEKPVPVVRCMPNTPCLIRCGMTGICAGRHARAEHLETVRAIFNSVGRTIVLDEKHMDAVTGLSASGPAFLYIVIESLAEGGVKVGLPREIATELAAQTMLGAARMVLETREHPAKLKDAVTTPAGCTVDGILQLEEGGLRVTLIKAIVEATRRASELLHD